jgi:hypothetical protein
MIDRSHVRFAGMLMRGLRELHPGQANRRPALFILEVSVALLSVLALRDGMLGSSAASLETLFAIGLWATLLAATCGLTIRRGDPAQARWTAPEVALHGSTNGSQRPDQI